MFNNFCKPPLYPKPSSIMGPLCVNIKVVDYKDPYAATRPQDVLYPFSQKRTLTIKIPKSNFNFENDLNKNNM